MFSSLFRPKRRQRRGILSPPRSVGQAERDIRDSTADVHSEADALFEEDNIDEYEVNEEEYEDVPDGEYQAPLLPMFSAPHLGMNSVRPAYNMLLSLG